MKFPTMKLSTIAFIAAVAVPAAALADSSQPNSAPGLQGKPVTHQGEGTSGMDKRVSPHATTNGSGTTDAGKTGHAGTRGASDSSIPGATNPNEPVGSNRNK
jgi:hypothetical protein